MNELASTFAYSCDELAALGLPGLPASRQGWDLLVKRDKWPFVEIKSKGRGGIRREYQPPAEVLALIQRRKLAAVFNSYRETHSTKESLGESESLFVSDYNAGSPSVTHVEGIHQITVETLREARRGLPISVPEQPAFNQQERTTEDRDSRFLKGQVWLNVNVLTLCREAVDYVLADKGKCYSDQWCMAAAIEAYNHVLTSIGTDDATAYEMLGLEEYKAAATLGILALSTKKDDELFTIPITAVYLKPEPSTVHRLPAPIQS